MARLEIQGTWDGRAIGDDEACKVELTASTSAWRVEIDAPFHDDPPPPGPGGSTEGLWDFEVVELFVAAAVGGPRVAYTEVELSPHGHHLVLRLAGVRRRLERVEPLTVQCVVDGDRWRGVLELPSSALPAPPWRANAFAMHGQGPCRRYLAAAPVAGARPDFHQPGLFPLFSSWVDGA